jgi:hypothetical protein
VRGREMLMAIAYPHITKNSDSYGADNLGHTVDEHTKTYQRWFGIENRKKAFGEVISQKSLIELQKNEILALRMENERLKLEVERLRLLAFP